MRKKIFTGLIALSLLSIAGGMTIFGSIQDARADTDGYNDGLAAYWNFDEGTGTIAHDSSGNNYHGTVHNANWTTGVLGSGLEFRDTDYVEDIPMEFDDTITSNFTIMAWVYSDPEDPMYHQDIFDARTGAYPTGRGFILNIISERLHFRLQTPTGSYWVNSTSIFPVHKWTHVAGIFDNITHELTIYIDGNMDNSSSVLSPYYGTTDKASIGNNHWAPGDGTWATFNGIIDEVRFYNHSLSAVEISGYVNQCLASTVYVDDDYTSSTPGWGVDHFDVIQDGIDAVAPGGTVYVLNGYYYESVMIDKTISLIGEDRYSTSIDGGGTGNVIYVSSDGVIISGFTIKNGYSNGLYLYHSDNNTFTGNTFTNNTGSSIYLETSSSNIITGNIMTNDGGGIGLRYSSNNNIITGNTITEDYTAIHLYESNTNIIMNNTIKNDENGIVIASSSRNTISGNTITYTRESISLAYFSTKYNIITSNTVRNNLRGVELYECSNTLIADNTIEHNQQDGIRLDSLCYKNTIVGNIIAHNSRCVAVYCSNHNSIYHNNFIAAICYDDSNSTWGESNNTWDNGYPSGGNYWSFYTGIDANSDGIGDTPVNISGGDKQDRYPLMHPYGDIVEKTIVESHPLIGGDSIYAGNGFTLFIDIDPKEAIAGVQFDLSFDPTLFQAGSVHEGSLFYGSNTYFNPGIVDNINGTIKDVYVVITTPGDNVTHSGEAVYINFTASLGVIGTSWFNLSNVVVGRPDGSSIPIATINASVTVLPNEPWDVNNDDHVNILDLILIGQHWGETGPPCWIPADVNCDGVVNILDMILVGQHWTG